MYVTLSWMLLAGLRLSTSTHDAAPQPARLGPESPGRVAVWVDRDDPYDRGDAARVYLRAEQPSHVAVFRVDTDGRIRVLFPREPWGDTRVREARDLEIAGAGGRRSFVVDDDPGIGYLFAVASPRALDFAAVARGDHWDYRAIEGGRISGDPHVALSDLAARLASGDDYDYDITPYYVERRYEYPRFVCYDCHAYAEYDEWDPYRRACARFRVVIYDDPRYYPYRSGRGRNIVMQRPRHPEPRYVFRDADPDRDYVTRVAPSGAGEYRQRQTTGRTSRDVGGPGSVPVPGLSSDRAARRMAPSVRAVPSGPPARDEEERDTRRRRLQPDTPAAAPRVRPSERKPREEPQSTGEPELRRRKP
jgi:hypothetical protein